MRIITASGLSLICLAAGNTAAQSQQAEGADVETAPQPIDGALDLTLRQNEDMDTFDLEHCEEEQDAASISNTIIVCRKRNDAAVSGFDKEKWERDYANRTQGIKSVSVDGSGIKLPGEGSIIAATVTSKIGAPPPPPLIIDIEALPQAPAGSDADRIARGLPPIGNDKGDAIATELKPEQTQPNPAESEAPAEAR